MWGKKKRDQFKEHVSVRNNKVHVCRLLLLTLANAHSFQGPVVSYGSTEHSATPPTTFCGFTCKQHFDHPISR